MNRIILILLLISYSAFATMEKSYQEGKEFADQQQNHTKNMASDTALKDVPKFNGADINETKLDKNGNFDDAIQNKLNQDEAAKNLLETSKSRQRFNLDISTDPLFKDPQVSSEETLGIDNHNENDEKEGVVEKTCEEGGENIEYVCHENNMVDPEVPLKSTNMTVYHLNFQANNETYQHMVSKGKWNRHAKYETRTRQNGWNVSLPVSIEAFRGAFCHNFQPTYTHNDVTRPLDCNRIQSYHVHSYKSAAESNGVLNVLTEGKALNVTIFHDTYEGEGVDEWRNDCEALEKEIDDGLCQYGERILTQGPETRIIKGYPIYKDAWQYQQKYICKMVKDECSSLKAQGCYQVDSSCKEMKQDKCWVYEQKYHCPSGKIIQRKVKAPQNSTFCLTGNCLDTSYTANAEMLDAISKLNVLRQIQQEIKEQGIQNLQLFKGTDNRCSRNCISFKDCCGGMKGWGVSLHIAGCKDEEKQLALMRQKNLCVQIGTYCLKKVMKKCVSKKTTFCCFASKLGRVLQEQGRAQLGIHWGTAECPVCRGFTLDELSKMDMSKMNFQEIFEDVMKNYKMPDAKSLQEKTSQKIQENLKNIENGSKIRVLNPKSGLLDENKSSL